MTKQLEKAFEEASKLPEVEQNALAKWLLDELHSEQKWAKAFAESEDVLERLSDEAIEEKRKGEATPPSGKTQEILRYAQNDNPTSSRRGRPLRLPK